MGGGGGRTTHATIAIISRVLLQKELYVEEAHRLRFKTMTLVESLQIQNYNLGGKKKKSKYGAESMFQCCSSQIQQGGGAACVMSAFASDKSMCLCVSVVRT